MIDNMRILRKPTVSSAFLWMVICAFIIVMPLGDNNITHAVLTLTLIASYILCIYNWLASGNRITSLYVFFVLYMFFSNAGQSLLYILGLPDIFLSSYAPFSIGEMNYMLRYQIFAIAGFNLGSTFYISKPENNYSYQEQLRDYKNCPIQPGKYNSVLTILLYASYIYLFVIAFMMIALRQDMGYSDFYEEKQDFNSLMVQIAEVLSIVIGSIFIYEKKHIKFIFLSSIFLILSYSITGARGLSIRYVAFLLLTAPLAFPRLFEKGKRWMWVVIAVVYFASLSIISANRYGDLSNALANENTLEMNVYNTISEMGITERTIPYTMIAVDNGTAPHYQTIFCSIVGAIVPFIHRIPFFEENWLLLSGWVTDYANSFSGLGYSIISESYMNYGWFGFLFMMLYGWFISYAELSCSKKMANGKYIIAAFLLFILCKQVFYARAEMHLILGYIRLSIYLLIVAFIFRRK